MFAATTSASVLDTETCAGHRNGSLLFGKCGEWEVSVKSNVLLISYYFVLTGMVSIWEAPQFAFTNFVSNKSLELVVQC